MIVCSNCGTSNSDDTEFCRKCHAFLAWEGTRVESGKETGDRTPDDDDAREPVSLATVAADADRRTSADGRDDAGRDDAGRGTAVVTSELERGADTAGGRLGATSAGGAGTGGGAGGRTGGATGSSGSGGSGAAAAEEATGPRVETTRPADSDSRPVGATSTDPLADRVGETGTDLDGSNKVAARQPNARQPNRTVQRPRVPRLDEPLPQQATGERPCPKCGRGNNSKRRFCQFCGNSMEIIEEKERPSWWRRLLDRLSKRRKPERRATGVARRIIKITAFLCALTILAVVGPRFAARGVNAVRDWARPGDPIVPVEVTASSSDGAQAGPERIIDGASNRYWAPKGKAVDAWVKATFAGPVRLTDIVIHSGISKEQELFLTVGRPHELTLDVTTAGGEKIEKSLSLRDRPGEQKFKFRVSDVVQVRIVIRSTYGPESEPIAALAEVEFFGQT